MPCGAYPNSPINYWLNWRFIDGAVCVFGDQLGVFVTMLIFFGVTFLVLYLASGNVLLPVGMIIVLAPVVSGLMPAIGIRFAAVVMILGLAVVGTHLYTSTGR